MQSVASWIDRFYIAATADSHVSKTGMRSGDETLSAIRRSLQPDANRTALSQCWTLRAVGGAERQTVGRTVERQVHCFAMSAEDPVARVRRVILAVSIVGGVAFVGAFVTSFVRPTLIESLAQELVRREVEKRTLAAVSSWDGSVLGKIARRVVGENETRIAELKAKLAAGVPERVGAIVAEMRNADCECRHFIVSGVTAFFRGEIASLAVINERLNSFIRAKYMQVAAALLREFRIFTAANALVFLLLGLVTLLRGRAALQLIVPAGVLLVSASLVASLYLFSQDWIHTIVFNEYVGFGYFAYLAVSLAFLADIVLNRARISTVVVNLSANAVGATIQAIPC